MPTFHKPLLVWLVVPVFLASGIAYAQSLGNAGTVKGMVVDPSGAVVGGAQVRITNPVTGYSQTAKSGSDGTFQLSNLPPNPYHLEITAEGFSVFTQDVTVRGALPVQVNAKLTVLGSSTTINVDATGSGVLEVDPTAHTDADRSEMIKLPSLDPAGGLSQAIVMNTGGVAADGNGFFHPLGDHAQTLFVIDNQPISDQQSKVFSTQLPVNAIQSMELDTGTPTAEFGDKTSLVAQVTTRSGLGSNRVFGNVDTSYGSFGTTTGSIALGLGNDKYGNFFAGDGVRSGRFLDSPQFLPIHDIGNSGTFFDRADYQMSPSDIIHLNLFAARNWFQIPDSFDQAPPTIPLLQDQRQKVVTWSVAPGYQHTFNSQTLLTVNPYVRKDQLEYFPSSDFLVADQPATQSQNRHLFNWGVKADLSRVSGRHSMKFGIDLKQTRLFESFHFGVTDPTFNAPCLLANGNPDPNRALTNPSQCAAPDSQNSGWSAGLAPYDLTRAGSLFAFLATHNVNQYAFYVQDAITAGDFVFNLGIRGDIYDGLVFGGQPEPRLGIAYHVKPSGTVLRISYARTFETPFNENLLLSSATGVGGLTQSVFGASAAPPIPPGQRNQFNAGFEQAVGHWLLIDADYFWKYTHNAYDFSTLLNTTITFPISWNNSKLDGFTGRVSTTNLHGFQAYWTFGHTRARYFPPETGGLTTAVPPAVFRIDHDQAFQSTLNFRYQRPKQTEWISLIWRFDSGLVVSGVPDAGAALALSPNDQVTIGLACNGTYATVSTPLSDCTNSGGSEGHVTSKLLTLPQGGYGPFPSQEQDDHNPDRVKPRHLFNVGIGSDNLLHWEGRQRLVASVEITNLTNNVALYNFHSTFSGTHFLQPRSVVGHFGFTF
jgi:hypothetical protein